MSAFHLAQLNVAHLKAPLDSPLLADFVGNLDRINALAESASGFIWRLQTPEGDATALRPAGPDTIVNMSVWTDVSSLSAFVFKSGHVDILKRRKEWFERMADAYTVLWWVPKGAIPTIDEALAKLDHLRSHGPSPEAFTFRTAAPPPDMPLSSSEQLQDECPAT